MAGAFIFDMDGVIIDSEPLWRRAMVTVFNAHGLPVNEVDCAQTTGMRIDEVIKLWNQKHPFTDNEFKVQQHIEGELCDLIRKEGKAMPGLMSTLSLISDSNVKIGLATSSSEKLLSCVLDTLKIHSFFLHTQSAEKLIYGKPHPEVFILTAQALGVDARNCVAIEDSLNGIISAKAAGMKVIAVPEGHRQMNPKFSIADMQLKSLEDFTLNILEQF